MTMTFATSESDRIAALRARAAEEALRRPDIGRKVRVVSGRKVPIGVEGTVFWSKLNRFGKRMLGITPSGQQDSQGRYADAVFTDAANVEVI